MTEAPAAPLVSPLLGRLGAVAAAAPDSGVPGHYGDPYAEQRLLKSGTGLVDRSAREVVRVDGADRLSWLHSLTTAHLAELAPGASAQSLLLSPHGHVEHHLCLVDDGATTWISVEPGTAAALITFLESMRFMLRVEVADATADVAVVWSPVERPELGEGPRFTAGFGVDHLVPRARLSELRELDGWAGFAAYEALRVEAGVPRLGLDTDHKTLPHEVGWIETAVHLNKGCYRGQETVARVHNLGRPPRRLVRLQLDGSADRLPAAGTPVTLEGDEVGFTGTAVLHHEQGPLALALIKRGTSPEFDLVADGIAAAQEEIVRADTGPAVVIPKLGRGVIPRPSR